MWISIEQSMSVSGIVYVFMESVVLIGHVQLSLLILGDPTWASITNRLVNYLSDFVDNWLKDVNIDVCQDGVCAIISQSDY